MTINHLWTKKERKKWRENKMNELDEVELRREISAQIEQEWRESQKQEQIEKEREEHEAERFYDENCPL